MTDSAQPSAPPATTSGQTPTLLLPEWSAELTTLSDLRLNVRPTSPDDEALLVEFFTHVAPDDVRFRFLTPMKEVRHDQLKTLLDVDHSNTENFLAFDESGKTLVATAMLAAEPSLERAEVAIAIRSDFKHRGIGWVLLQYVADQAAQRGIKTLESIECRDNREAIALETEMGFTATTCPGDATLVLVRKDLAGPQKPASVHGAG
ncbi:GNAT family N-acetyltransferase [Sphingosinicella rhizophila]|uniref:GNAT family N-acetyltransferase n=1 Tax=Sphingosinicella rhizophila TaxID=3050082 RepID=A0ABU3Q6F6_9SPHN|nr:GNAT family N-acetyltransferase [Sphingosinicella sp. GR2756]MDT9599001.1 GNAT family N-acetyltransferase [Sphingosinicella sp. GR2756]